MFPIIPQQCKDMNNNQNIRVIPSKKPADLVNISKDFLNFFKNETGFKTDMSIHAGRIIFKIISDLREDAWKYSNDVEQYRTLFDQEFQSDFNSFASFKFKISEISKSKNTEHIKTAIDYLRKYGDGWHQFTNAQGKKVSTAGGFITNATYTDGYVAFMVPKFWLKLLLNTTKFNSLLYDLVFKLRNTKHFLFNIWLISLKQDVTVVKIETINKNFFEGKGYSSGYELNRSFLKKVKQQLDKHSNVSFNYVVKGEYVTITRYFVADEKLLGNVSSSKSSHSLKVTQRLNYFKNRNGLDKNQMKRLRHLLLDENTFVLFELAFKAYKARSKKEGLKLTHYQGQEFLNRMQSYLEVYYRETPIGKQFPNNFPKLNVL